MCSPAATSRTDARAHEGCCCSAAESGCSLKTYLHVGTVSIRGCAVFLLHSRSLISIRCKILVVCENKGLSTSTKKNRAAPIIHPVLSLHTVLVVGCHVAIVTDIDPSQHQRQIFNPRPTHFWHLISVTCQTSCHMHPSRQAALIFFVLSFYNIRQ